MRDFIFLRPSKRAVKIFFSGRFLVHLVLGAWIYRALGTPMIIVPMALNCAFFAVMLYQIVQVPRRFSYEQWVKGMREDESCRPNRDSPD